jgi:protein phosphatase 2C family protein 2/3
MDSGDESDTTTTDADAAGANASGDASSASTSAEPIRPSFTSIGSPAVPTHEELQRSRFGAGDGAVPRQLTPQPGGDAYPAAAKIEGLLDKSENPLA